MPDINLDAGEKNGDKNNVPNFMEFLFYLVCVGIMKFF